jgi:transposase
MRGRVRKQEPMFVAVNINDLVDQRLAPDHPLRRIKDFTNQVLASMSDDFDRLYSDRGRYSVPPECLLRASLWQAMFSIRSERQLEETLRFDLRCRWFVDLPLDQDAWDHSTFSKARDAFLFEEFAVLFFEKHVEFLRAAGLVSNDHLSVDGTLLTAWASHKSLVPKNDLDSDGDPPRPPPGGRNAWVDFKGTKRSNSTHVSATDPEAKLASKGTGAKLSHELSVLAENRNNLAIEFLVASPTGTSERECAASMVAHLCNKGLAPKTVGGDRKYSDGDALVLALDELGVSPHFSVREDRPNALARVFESDPGYPISIRCRMRIEEIFAYVKGVAGLAQVKVRGAMRVLGVAAIGLAAYNLTRHASLTASV